MNIDELLTNIADSLERIATALEQLNDKADTHLGRTDPTWATK